MSSWLESLAFGKADVARNYRRTSCRWLTRFSITKREREREKKRRHKKSNRGRFALKTILYNERCQRHGLSTFSTRPFKQTCRNRSVRFAKIIRSSSVKCNNRRLRKGEREKVEEKESNYNVEWYRTCVRDEWRNTFECKTNVFIRCDRGYPVGATRAR